MRDENRAMKDQVDRARSLRRQLNWAEKTLWKKLRDRKVLAFKFRRQHPFGPYFLDFYCPESKVAIELDGDTHGNPIRHAKDKRKDDYLKSKSVRVLRFWNHHIRENLDGVMMVIRNELDGSPSLEKNPHPLPSPKGEERGEG